MTETIASKLRSAWPGWGLAVGGSLAWAVLMTLSAWLKLSFWGWQGAPAILTILLTVAIGGFLSFLPGWMLARMMMRRAHPPTVLAAAFLAHALATIGLTSILYALLYRGAYSEDHAPFLTLTWAIQFVITVAGALYQFAVIGTRLYLPLGLIALVALTLVHLKPPR